MPPHATEAIVFHFIDKNRIKSFSLNLFMDTIRIDILDPKAKKLLEDLEALNLISIKKDNRNRFKEHVKQLRTKLKTNPSFEEITKEVELVRAKRHSH